MSGFEGPDKEEVMARKGGSFCVALMLVASFSAVAWCAEDTPTAVTAISREELTDAPVTELADLLNETRGELKNAQRRIGELEQKMGAVEGTMATTNESVHSLSTQFKQIEFKSREVGDQTGVIFKPYGYIKVDMAYDDTRTSGTGATAFVLPETTGFGSDRHFTMTARQTRLGLNIAGPDIGEGKSAGKIEVDFYAPASVENKAQLMMRQAYWQVTYPTWNVLVGQAWEVTSPAFPNILNYAYLALSGNPGYRKPMVLSLIHI